MVGHPEVIAWRNCAYGAQRHGWLSANRENERIGLGTTSRLGGGNGRIFAI
jgi:hypothetical protein